MKSLQGQLLISSPTMGDPHFDRTIVLIVKHGDQGALGLILNKTMPMTIDDVWPQVSDTPCLNDAPLHQGGPCEASLMVLHVDPALSQMQVMPDVYFTNEKEDIQSLVAMPHDARHAKFFVGYAGWGAGQLENELEGGAWLITPAESEHIFETTAELWDILRRRITLQSSWPWIRPEHIPDDPSAN